MGKHKAFESPSASVDLPDPETPITMMRSEKWSVGMKFGKVEQTRQ
jgi:hypothetical protein